MQNPYLYSSFLKNSIYLFQKAPSLRVRAPCWWTALWLAQMTVLPVSQSRQSPGSTVKTASWTQRSTRAPSRRPPAQQRQDHQKLEIQEFQPSIQECGNARHTEVSQEKKTVQTPFLVKNSWDGLIFWSGRRMLLQQQHGVKGRSQTAEQEIIELKTSLEWILD